MSEIDATVVGAGPNGLAAAIELARSGRKVVLVEAADHIGGGTRTEELTLPGFRHDVCSAIHPSAVASPFLNEIGLDVEWIHPEIPFAHPLDDGDSVALFRSVEETAAQFPEDAARYHRLMDPFVANMDRVVEDILSPMTVNPRNKGMFARSAAIGGLSTSLLAGRFDTDGAKALIAGAGAHAIAPFNAPATASVGLMLAAIGHSHGWPMAAGGSQSIADALADQFTSLGGSIETGRRVVDVADVPGDLALLDVMPGAAASMTQGRIDPGQKRRLDNWRPGPGIFKVDWALDAPIPWADELSPRAATVHLGGLYDEVEQAERAVFEGQHPDRPFVLLAQQSLFDHSRAPEGKHTAWAYCHVPNGSTVDMTDAIENQVERFAPGFKEVILERHTMSSLEFQSYNPNYVGGDIGGGTFGIKKILQMGRKRPYALGGGIFLCSAATPPGAGVHGMCGYNAARAALD